MTVITFMILIDRNIGVFNVWNQIKFAFVHFVKRFYQTNIVSAVKIVQVSYVSPNIVNLSNSVFYVIKFYAIRVPSNVINVINKFVFNALYVTVGFVVVILVNIIMETLLLPFLIGSSVVPNLPIFTYMTAHHMRQNPPQLPMAFIFLVVPVVNGIANVITVNLMRVYGYGTNFAFLPGVILGLLFSLIGRFGFKIPEKLYVSKQITGKNEWRVHHFSVLIYACIWRFVIQNLNFYL